VNINAVPHPCGVRNDRGKDRNRRMMESGCIKGFRAINAIKGIKAATIDRIMMLSFRAKRRNLLLNRELRVSLKIEYKTI